MSFPRSISTKLAEAIVIAYRFDSVMADYFGQRMYVGPWATEDGAVSAPQLHVAAIPDAFQPGVSGVSDSTASIVVVMFDYLQSGPSAFGAVGPVCRLKYLRRLIMKGSSDPLDMNQFNNQGKLLDPDNAMSMNNNTRWLNTSPARFQEYRPRRARNSNGEPFADAYSFTAAFPSRQLNVSGDRA